MEEKKNDDTINEYRRQKPIFKPNSQNINFDSKKNNEEIELSTKFSENIITNKNNNDNNNIQKKNRGVTNYYRFNTSKERNTINLKKQSAIQDNKRKLSRLTKGAFYDNNKLLLTQQQRLFLVNIIKRNYDNNIYLNNTDQSISFVIPYKYKCPLFMFLLLGIPFIITKFSNKKLIEWRGEPCSFHEANFYLIIDGYGNYHICNFTKKYFNIHFKTCNQLRGFRTKKHIPTLFSSIDFKEKEEYHEIIYVYNKYYCYKKLSNSNYDINKDNKKNIKKGQLINEREIK